MLFWFWLSQLRTLAKKTGIDIGSDISNLTVENLYENDHQIVLSDYVLLPNGKEASGVYLRDEKLLIIATLDKKSSSIASTLIHESVHALNFIDTQNGYMKINHFIERTELYAYRASLTYSFANQVGTSNLKYIFPDYITGLDHYIGKQMWSTGFYKLERIQATGFDPVFNP